MAITINNSANITYQYGTLTDTAKSNLVTTMMAESYSLIGTKTSLNTNWRPSENLTFMIRIENNGSEPLYAVSMQDDLGGTTRLLSYIPCSAKMLRNDVLIGITPTNMSPLTMVIPGTLEAGGVVVFTYVAKVIGDIDASINEITNTVTVVGHETSDMGPTVTIDPPLALTLPIANYADVRIEKLVDKEEIVSGDNLTYTFVLENSGNIEATNVVIKDTLPTGFTINSITSTTNGVVTEFEATDYSVGEGNKLVLPTSTLKTISVPAATSMGVGVTRVTIVGTVTI